MKSHKDETTITKMAMDFGVSEVHEVNHSAYYRWERYGLSHQRKDAEARLVDLLKKIAQEHHYRYGEPRIRAELARVYGIAVSRKRVTKLLRKHGLNARKRRKWIATTNSNHGLPVCENLLNRDFHASIPGEKWVSDLTYLWTTDGWLYLTTVIDLFDREVIGWSFSTDMSTEHTTVPALVMACRNRKAGKELLFHSDRGIQYCAGMFRTTLQSLIPSVRQSMSRKRNCWDNACAETFFKTLKTELEILDGKHSKQEVRAAVFYYIASYYNRKRLHSALDYQVPSDVSSARAA